MKINTKSRLAIAAIIDVAEHGTEKPVALGSVGKRQDISVSYLEQLFSKLRSRGIVSAMRGPGGGYRLTRDISTITVADVIAAVDDENLGACECPDGYAGGTCISDGLWCRIDHHLRDYLSTVTLESVLKDNHSNMSPGVLVALPAESRLVPS